MVVVSMLSHVDFGSNDHRDDALHFTINIPENDWISNDTARPQKAISDEFWEIDFWFKVIFKPKNQNGSIWVIY